MAAIEKKRSLLLMIQPALSALVGRDALSAVIIHDDLVVLAMNAVWCGLEVEKKAASQNARSTKEVHHIITIT